MRALRWTEVLLPLLAARGWAPWLVEPRHARQGRAKERPQLAAARQASRSDREPCRLPFDDLQ
jgi:hypothetical protein